MTALKLSMVLRRTACFVRDFDHCRVAADFSVHRCRVFSTQKNILSDNDDTTKPQKPKKVWKPRITLFLQDDSMLVTDIESAQRLAKRRNLSLDKICDLDSKSQRPTYRLLSNSGILEDSSKDDNSKNDTKQKAPKMLYLSEKITEHDLMIKIKKIIKALNKGNKYKVHITLNDAKEDDILGIITEAMKNDGSIKKLTSKKNTALLLISPLNKDNDTVP